MNMSCSIQATLVFQHLLPSLSRGPRSSIASSGALPHSSLHSAKSRYSPLYIAPKSHSSYQSAATKSAGQKGQLTAQAISQTPPAPSRASYLIFYAQSTTLLLSSPFQVASESGCLHQMDLEAGRATLRKHQGVIHILGVARLTGLESA